MSSEICAIADGDDDIAAANAASTEIFLAEIKAVLPIVVRRIGRIA
jgi:hypothetical protein